MTIGMLHENKGDYYENGNRYLSCGLYYRRIGFYKPEKYEKEITQKGGSERCRP